MSPLLLSLFSPVMFVASFTPAGDRGGESSTEGHVSAGNTRSEQGDLAAEGIETSLRTEGQADEQEQE